MVINGSNKLITVLKGHRTVEKTKTKFKTVNKSCRTVKKEREIS